jgi:hypothetical protein
MATGVAASGALLQSDARRFEADYVARRNRLTTFFRLLPAIPVAIVLYEFGIIASVAVPPFQDEQTRAAGAITPA